MKKQTIKHLRAGKLSPVLTIAIAASLMRGGALVCKDNDDPAAALTALKASVTTLSDAVTALKAKATADANNAQLAGELKAKENELELVQLRIAHTELKAKEAANTAALVARQKTDATDAVKRAVTRGAVPAQDQGTQDALVAKATDDPAFLTVINALAGNPALSGRITPTGVTVTAEAPNAVMKQYAALVCANAALPLNFETRKEKGRLAREAAALFAKEINDNVVIEGMGMEDALKAAENTNASVGLLSGTLVLQRALPALMYKYPLLGMISSDFSDAPGLLDQTEMSRITLKPAVQTRSRSVGSDGRPLGWNTVSAAQSVDVPVTLTDHVGVPVVFGQDILASTVRNLFQEQAPQSLNAIGGYAVDMLTALMTAAGFNAYASNSVDTGATTDGSTTITVASTANMFAGQEISGTGIPSKTYVASIVDGTTVKLTQAATATGAALTFTLNGGRVPTTYPTFVKALADFDVAAIGDAKAAFDNNQVPEDERFMLLNSTYHSKAANAPALNSFFAAMQKPEIITKGALPEIQGFQPINAPWLTTAANRFGFFGHKASLVLKSRLPNDITTATEAHAPGNVTTVTAPGGISVMLVQYVALREGYAEWRPEVILGAARGERRCGLVGTSA